LTGLVALAEAILWGTVKLLELEFLFATFYLLSGSYLFITGHCPLKKAVFEPFSGEAR